MSLAQHSKRKNWEGISDEAVWKGFRAGDHSALEYIYNAHVRDLYNYGYQVLPDEAWVKDGIQEVFINLWRNRENLSSKVCIKYYLFKALRRQLIKYIDKDKKAPQEHLTTTAENLVWENDHEHSLIKSECAQDRNQELNAAINQLPERQREVIYLIFYKNLPYEEAADILSITLPSAYTLVWKAIKKLKAELKQAELFIMLLMSASLF